MTRIDAIGRRAVLAGVALAGTASTAAQVMYMVRRTYATDRDIAALRTPAEPAHQKHLLQFSDTVVSSAIIDGGKRIGSVSISDSGGRAEIEAYVYDDPFTKAGIYGTIAITAVELIVLDGSYNRAPAWFAPELQRRQCADGFDVPVLPTGDVGAKTMFAVRHASDGDVAAARTVVTVAILDEAGRRTGTFSIHDTEDRAAIERAIAGRFAGAAIERVDLYKLDGSYRRPR